MLICTFRLNNAQLELNSANTSDRHWWCWLEIFSHRLWKPTDQQTPTYLFVCQDNKLHSHTVDLASFLILFVSEPFKCIPLCHSFFSLWDGGWCQIWVCRAAWSHARQIKYYMSRRDTEVSRMNWKWFFKRWKNVPTSTFIDLLPFYWFYSFYLYLFTLIFCFFNLLVFTWSCSCFSFISQFDSLF